MAQIRLCRQRLSTPATRPLLWQQDTADIYDKRTTRLPHKLPFISSDQHKVCQSKEQEEEHISVKEVGMLQASDTSSEISAPRTRKLCALLSKVIFLALTLWQAASHSSALVAQAELCTFQQSARF